MTENSPSSVRLGSRPSARTMRSYSSGGQVVRASSSASWAWERAFYRRARTRRRASARSGVPLRGSITGGPLAAPGHTIRAPTGGAIDESGDRSEHRGLQQADGPRARVDLHLQPHRKRELLVDVADHRAAERWDAERLQMVVQDLVERERAVALAGLAVGAAAEHDALHPAQHAREEPAA